MVRCDGGYCPFRYAGQYFDSETNLCYNRFRYYSPETGSYLSQDPIGLAGNNPTLYAYVHDLNTWLDPFGLDCTKAVSQLPKLKGKSVSHIQKILQENGFTLKNPTNTRNQRWVHSDGSEVQIHKYGNTNSSPHKGGNNAHIHKSIGKHGEMGTTELADDGVTVVSQRSAEAHIGIKILKITRQYQGDHMVLKNKKNMAAELYVVFENKNWYCANKDKIKEKIMSLNTFIYREGDEFWLRGIENFNNLDFDVRLFLKYAEYIMLEISVHPLSIEQSLEQLLHWIRLQTPINVQDEDGEISNW